MAQTPAHWSSQPRRIFSTSPSRPIHHISPIMSQSSQPYHLDLQFRGYIEGLTYLDDASHPQCHFFGGIPYALPPIGDYRFRKPRALPPCYRYGTKINPARFVDGCGVCPQILTDKLRKSVSACEEDCLQANVWIPAGKAPDGGMWMWYFLLKGGFSCAVETNL